MLLVAFLASLVASSGVAVLPEGMARGPTRHIKVLVVDCKCHSDLVLDAVPAGITATPHPGADTTCTPHCNNVDNCGSDAVNCCPAAGFVTVGVSNWSIACPNGTSQLDIHLNDAYQGTLSSTGTASMNVTAGGTGIICSGTSDNTEAKGDKIVLTCAGGATYTIIAKDVCVKCPG